MPSYSLCLWPLKQEGYPMRDERQSGQALVKCHTVSTCYVALDSLYFTIAYMLHFKGYVFKLFKFY